MMPSRIKASANFYSVFTGWSRGQTDNKNQSDGRTKTINSNIFKSSQSNVRYKAIASLNQIENISLL